MRTLINLAILFATAAPAWADTALDVPEPSVLALISIGAVAVLVGRRGNKK